MNDDLEYDKDKHSLRNTAIILVILLAFAAVSFFVVVKLLSKSEKKTVKTNKVQVEEKATAASSAAVEAKNQQNNNAVEKTAKIDSSSYTVEQIYYDVHLRANTIIIADGDQIWEETPIDKEFLNYTIEVVKDKDETLYNMLLPWKSKDFSNAVEVHNYVWEKLGGTVGKAIGINEDKVNALKQKLAQ